MKLLNGFWGWLNGKKTVVATIFWSVTMPCLNIIYPNGIPSTLNKTTLIIGTVLSVLGIGHKVAKNFQSDDEDVATPSPVATPEVQQGNNNDATDKKVG